MNSKKKNYELKTPIVMLVFNRPDTTYRVFERIQMAKPRKLLVVADGPREGKAGEDAKCMKVREVIRKVDWECELLTHFSDSNLGCRQRVSSGLNWVFDQVEEAIILEDDCLPDTSFFRYCSELLGYYRHDERIMVISGNNFQQGKKRSPFSYYFSLYNHCWGWATWKRAWKFYDSEMKLWPYIKKNGWLKDILCDNRAVKYWENFFQNVYEEKINSWAVRWTFSCWTQSGLTVLPNINLVSNIGFDSQATHTRSSSSRLKSIPSDEMELDLAHPPFIIRDVQADRFTQRTVFNSSLSNRILQKIKGL